MQLVARGLGIVPSDGQLGHNCCNQAFTPTTPAQLSVSVMGIFRQPADSFWLADIHPEPWSSFSQNAVCTSVYRALGTIAAWKAKKVRPNIGLNFT